jgi:CubicO group peptidase (beta-lactamase class C family)
VPNVALGRKGHDAGRLLGKFAAYESKARRLLKRFGIVPAIPMRRHLGYRLRMFMTISRFVRLAMIAPMALACSSQVSADAFSDGCFRLREVIGKPFTLPPKLDASALETHMLRGEAIGYSGAAAVEQKGKLILNRGYGFADLESGQPMTAEAVFDVGSVSKQFTAAAIVKLEEQGRLRTSDRLARFFPNVPADKGNITLHELLTHTSGLPANDLAMRDTTTRAAMLAAAFVVPLERKPGEKYEYSNVGYALLAAVVEKASGQWFESYLRHSLWLPAGMTHTGYVLFDRRGMTFAKGYDMTGPTPTPQPGWWIADGPTFGRRGPAGILSTMPDMRRWVHVLATGNVLSKTSVRKLLTPYVRERAGVESFYGYGWALARSSSTGACVISHNGNNNLHYNLLAVYPAQRLILQVLSLQALSPLRSAIFDPAPRILFGVGQSEAPLVAEPTSQEAMQLAGAWRTEDGEAIEIEARGTRLFIASASSGAARIFTPFQLLSGDDERLISVSRKAAPRAIDALARGDYAPLFQILSAETTPAEEQRYWPGQWKEWESAHGRYLGSELIATTHTRGRLVTYVLLKFARSNGFAAIYYDESCLAMT